MRLLILFCICLISYGCNNGDPYHPGYVISKSNETPPAEAPTEQD